MKKQKMLKKQKANELSNKKKRQKIVQAKNSTEPYLTRDSINLNSLNNLDNQKFFYPDSLDKYDRFLKQKVLYSDNLGQTDGGTSMLGTVRK